MALKPIGFTFNNPLSGSFAQVLVGGELLAECDGITAKVTDTRTDVQIGIDVGSKKVGQKGEGTISIKHVYTDKIKLMGDKLKGRDKTYTIIAYIQDPDAIGGQEERWALYDCIFTDTTLFEWKNGEVAKKEMPFIFPASKVKLQKNIK